MTAVGDLAAARRNLTKLSCVRNRNHSGDASASRQSKASKHGEWGLSRQISRKLRPLLMTPGPANGVQYPRVPKELVVLPVRPDTRARQHMSLPRIIAASDRATHAVRGLGVLQKQCCMCLHSATARAPRAIIPRAPRQSAWA